MQEIEDLKNRVQAFHLGGYEIFCVDECIFSPKSYKPRKEFAPAGRPLEYSHQKTSQPYIAVLGFAGVKYGFHHYDLHEGRAYDRWDFIDALKRFHTKMNGDKYALFLDNASIHKAKDTKYMAEEWGIPLIYNVPYRPDFNGIEFVWGWAKQCYRKRIAASVIGT